MSRTGVFAISDRVLTITHAELSCDVHVEQRPDSPAKALSSNSDGTYARLWPTAVVLSRYLCAHPELVRGKRVVELGAGGGAVGLVCAALGAQRVVITDVPAALQLLSDNLARNPELAASGRVSVAPCTWGDACHIGELLAAGRFDVCVCCEVVYKQEEEVLLALAETQDRLLAEEAGAEVLLAYEFRSNLLEDYAYFGAANELFELDQIRLREYEGELADAGADDDDDSRLLYRYTRKARAAAST